MRVLLINHFPLQGSGSGIYTLNIANELVKTGNEVFVIDIDNTIDNNEYSFLRRTIMCDEKINPDADLSFNFPCFTTHPRSTTTYYDLSDEQIREYIKVFCKVTNEVCKEFSPDIIHAQHLWITPYAAMKTGLPYIITVHGTDLMGFRKDERYHSYALKTADKAGGIITISHQVHVETKLLYKLHESKLTRNPNGFDDDIFRIKEVVTKEVLQTLNIKEVPEQIISFVGKFTDFKGIDILIKAAKVITLRFPNVMFILAGDGELRKPMEELAKSLGLSNIKFVGHQDQNTISSIYNIADVSVVPSRIEPFGLVAVEALACGTPVVATNAGGLPDFINSEVGQLVEMNNSEALADAVIDEVENNSKKTKGKYAAKYALENFSWKRTLQNVLELYKIVQVN